MWDCNLDNKVMGKISISCTPKYEKTSSKSQNKLFLVSPLYFQNFFPQIYVSLHSECIKSNAKIVKQCFNGEIDILVSF